MWILRKIGLFILLCLYLTSLFKVSATVDRRLLVNRFMNMTKTELFKVFNQQQKTSAQTDFYYFHQRSKHRTHFASLAAILERKPRGVIISHREELTVGQMHELASNVCRCGAKPKIDVILEYYYSIKDISIGGMCNCHGHARECPFDSNSGKLSCNCEHHTTGTNCEACLPAYNQLRWEPGNDGFNCEECNCYGHAGECYYDSGVEERRESVNIRGDRIGGGVCVGCRDNTDGVNCETCADGYYRPVNVEPNAENPCLPCHCNMHGTLPNRNSFLSFLCVKDVTKISMKENSLPGHCICKTGYEGSKCSRCAPGYHGFPRCEPCSCNVSGALNSDTCDGECVCKRNVIGTGCSLCQTGFYNLQISNPLGCQQCFCFGVTSVCHSSSLRWSTVNEMVGWEVRERNERRKSEAIFDFSLNELFVDHSQVIQDIGSTMYYWSSPRTYLGQRLSSYGGYLRYTVSYSLENGHKPHLLQEPDVVLVGNDKTLIYNRFGILLEPGIKKEMSIKLIAPHEDTLVDQWIDAKTLFPATKADIMSVLFDIKKLLIRAVYTRNNQAIYRISNVHLDVAVDDGDGDLANSVEVCHCPAGYSGFSCENCIQGYYRKNSQCLPCQCYGHSNVCNSLNGACENCDHNTMGIHCERCKPGFYGDATWGTSNDCQSCACPLPMSSNNFSPTCHLDRINGEMICEQCPVGYQGKRCEACKDGYFGRPSIPGGSCQICHCNGNAQTCNRESGKCLSCQSHTAGNNCERCEAAYYGDAIIEKNCQTCSCNPIGSLSRQCDAVTGQCLCKNGVHGRKCDKCMRNHYLSSTAGMCVSCDCNAIGSEVTQCLPDGTCQCKRGVIGRLCDSCDKGYYRFSHRGCRACSCERTSGNCHPRTGQCVCSPNTWGYKCLRCRPGFYQWSRQNGCKSCKCDVVGSINPFLCNDDSGNCQCKKEFSGRRCNQCKKGFYGFPNCKPCKCNAKGTEPSSCHGRNSKKCNCSENGQCFCKANVVGKRCNQCAANTISLAKNHPEGCTSCYCSGVTTRCTQAQFVWGNPISLNSLSVNLLNKTESDVLLIRNMVSHGNNVFWMTSGTKPYYWKLPKQFNGNQSLSYGGKLQYTIRFVSQVPSSAQFDQDESVIIRGGNEVLKTIQFRNSKPLTDSTTTYVVLMREFDWTDLDSGRNVTRSEFLNVMTNIQSFLVKTSYDYFIEELRLYDVFLDSAIQVKPGRGDETNHYPLAVGVEKCFCPDGYIGLSCQNCAPGFMRVRKYPNGHLCKPCNCNNKSKACLMETGQCLNCKENFTGMHCETCKDGFYLAGNVCRKCGCPGIGSNNNFSPTCSADSTSENTDYTCDACRGGFEGKHCEQCADGFFGDPTRQDGFCAKCSCNVAGSIDGVCNKTTGQCHCDEGIRGRICDQCQPGHVITSRGCLECRDVCTKTLLIELEELKNETKRIDFDNKSPPPWNRLYKLQNRTDKLQMNLTQILDVSNEHLQTTGQVIEENVTDIQTRFSSVVDESLACSKRIKIFVVTTKRNHKRAKKQKKKFTKFMEKAEVTQNNLKKLSNQLQDSLNYDYETRKELVDTRMMEIKSRNLSLYLEVAKNNKRLSQSFVAAIRKNFTKKARKAKKRTLEKKKKLFSRLKKVYKKLNFTETTQLNVTRRLRSTKEKNKMNQQTLQQSKGKLVKLNNDVNSTLNFLNDAQAYLDVANALCENGSIFWNDSYSNNHSLKSILLNKADEVKDFTDSSLRGYSTSDLKAKLDRLKFKLKTFNNTSDHIDSVKQSIYSTSCNQTEAVFRWTNIAKMIETSNSNATKALQKAKQSRSSAGKNVEDKATKAQRQARVLLELGNQENVIHHLEREIHLSNENFKYFWSVERSVRENYEVLFNRSERAKKGFLKGAGSLTLDGVNLAIKNSMRVFNQMKKKLSSFQKAYQQLDVTSHSLEAVDGISKKLAGLPDLLSSVRNEINTTQGNSATVKLLNKGIRRKINNLKNLVEDARCKVASIRQAGVHSDGKCAMLYKPVISISKATKLILNFQISKPNNMLFYLTRNEHDYLAVETRDYKVSVTWDLGGGHGFLENPVSLYSKNGKEWHTIEIKRRNQNLSITVKNYVTSNGSETTHTVSGRSPGSFKVLDINGSDEMYVGGLMDNTKLRETLAYRTFSGCMGEAILQDKSIGLWNFKAVNDKTFCKICSTSNAVLENKRSKSYNFIGCSYSLLSLPKTYKKLKTKLSLDFQTYSSKGMILYMGSTTLNDFLSLEILNGKLVLKVDLGEGISSIKTKKRYNKGKWINVSVNRNSKNVTLEIRRGKKLRETINLHIQTSLEPNLDLKTKDIFSIGGFPSNKLFSFSRKVTTTSFVGCLRDFTFMNKALYLTTKETNDVLQDNSVSHSCPNKISHDIGIGNGGYVELTSNGLNESSSVSITFNTLESEALLLFATNKPRIRRKRKHKNLVYYTLFLSGGRIHAQVLTRSGEEVNLSLPEKKFNDGSSHLVSLSRINGRIILGTSEVKDGKAAVSLRNTISIATNRLFIGGIPKKYNISFTLGVRSSLNGCVREVFEKKRINFKEARKAKNAFFGTCRFVNFEPVPTLPPSTSLPNKTQDQNDGSHSGVGSVLNRPKDSSCKNQENFTMKKNATNFGISTHSYLQYRIKQSLTRRFLFEMEVRTQGKTGLLFYAGSKTNTDFIALKLKDGKPLFQIKNGNEIHDVSYSKSINDGKWHKISIRKIKRRGWLSVGDKKRVYLNSTKLSKDMGVKNTFYLGGLPGNFDKSYVGKINNSMDVCIHNLKLNKKVSLFPAQAFSSYQVRPCFENVESGTYFNGSGYLILKYKFRVGVNMVVEFDFRTWRSSAVLVSVYRNETCDGFSLELVNGTIYFRVDNGDGPIEVRYSGNRTTRGNETLHSLCDGTWHHVRAEKRTSTLVLTVDEQVEIVTDAIENAKSADTEQPLFIGGESSQLSQSKLLQTRQSFEGCIKNLVVKNSPVDMEEAVFRSGVLSSSCPNHNIQK